MIKSHPEYKKTPTDFIKKKLEYFDESYCDACGSKKGTFHANDYRCKYAIQGRNEMKEGYIKEIGKYTKYYRDPFNGWHEYHLMKYRENPEYQCRVCGEGTYEKDQLCEEHAKKLFIKQRNARKMYEMARREEKLLELEFYKYETTKLSNQIELDD